MPIYVYRCSKCGHEGELYACVWDTADREIVCGQPRCKGLLVRIPAASNFSIKGFSARNGYSNG